MFTTALSSRFCFLAGAVLLSTLILCGCGKKGPVVALEAKLPVAPSQVSLSQRGSSLLLAWNIPEINQDGSELNNLKRFDIYRIDYAPDSGCPECRNPQHLLQQIDVDFYQSKERNSKRIYMWDHFVEPDTGYRYRIVPVTAKEQAGADATIHRPTFPASSPPTGLSARSSDRQVVLTWDAPEADDTSPGVLAGYNIYRSKQDEYFGVRPLNREPIAETTFEDLDLSNNTTYRYSVRSVVKEGEFILESDATPAISATPAPPL
jgi:hypothetical protein